MDLPIDISVHALLAFMEYLYHNSLSPPVIQNYISSIKSQASHYKWNIEPFSHHFVWDYLRRISINHTFSPFHRGTFDLHTLSKLSEACSHLRDPQLYRAAFFGLCSLSLGCQILQHTQSV